MTTQKNKNYWQKIANLYDTNVGEKGDIRHEIIINPVVFDFLGNLDGKIVLDAACGNGYLARKMAQTANKVFAVDFTEKFIKLAKRKNTLENLVFSVGNIETLEFTDKTFDAILCNMALMGIERLEIVIKELSRVLRNGGTLVVSIIHPCFENPPMTYSIFEEQIHIGRLVKNYFDTGSIVDKNQIVDNEQPYQHYHRLLSDYLNAFSTNYLFLEETSEPNGYEISKLKGVETGMTEHTPTFIIFKLKKLNGQD